MKAEHTLRKHRPDSRYRRMVVTAMLGAITALLAFTPIGMIMLPPPLPAVTLVHIPVIIAALVEGPVVGVLVGLVFGVSSLIRAWESGMVGLTLFFRNPLVSVLPRLIVPLAAWGVSALFHRGAKRHLALEHLGTVFASAIGALTNTVLCLGAIILLYGTELNELVNNLIGLGSASDAYRNSAATWLVVAVGLPNGIAELLVAAIIAPMVKTAVQAVNHRTARRHPGSSVADHSAATRLADKPENPIAEQATPRNKG
ncbi:MAG: ECF transporter S component [Candidatus Limiplasma sp.]|nr:ECF transporter S component [Candidatus Limiplasma sp.]MEA5144680.1 ECF transporter S component [Candidatus Limiplasma sp.]